MEVFPAIDLRNKQVVRLTQGDYNKMKVYGGQPADTAREFVGAGATNLHIIDLDGAKDGALVNLETIRDILATGQMFVQVGGGIRDEASIDAYLGLGVSRVILGTVAVEDFAFTQRMAAKHGGKISVSVDARDGKVATRGWLKDAGLDATEFCHKLEDAGVQTIIFTDISRDGLLEGVNAELYANLNSALGCNIIAAGGVSSLKDIEALSKIGLHGAIIGKALYEGKLKLTDALEGAKC
ncbi:MAG: 1-(5-phosphoribosyl)-5-[(5-phosphoribosylamino)methylideneamino]imidazole-4-carboxamide isomerase [Oscillospiraceae bacterium]|nr:1-(5-phosphoribosyl)-5-[(5-phosphoribosylamino)methylideneamino]imidazole-4-carboxamide isomerase [Oscillospiraceae bacterium]